MASLSSFTKKRIFADIRELQEEESDQYSAAPLEDNLFEWHFTIRGPPDTDFEGGLYHGRILLPTDYPFKPPNIIFLTPNGRFEVNKKICLSISAHHPEHWQPAWGVRLILEALISFLPTDAHGALGSLDYTPAERRALAVKSRDWVCPHCGPIRDLIPEPEPESDAGTDAEQTDGLSDGQEGSQPRRKRASQKKRNNKYAAEIAQLHLHNPALSPASKPSASTGNAGGSSSGAAAAADGAGETQRHPETLEPASGLPSDGGDMVDDVMRVSGPAAASTQSGTPMSPPRPQDGSRTGLHHAEETAGPSSTHRRLTTSASQEPKAGSSTQSPRPHNSREDQAPMQSQIRTRPQTRPLHDTQRDAGGRRHPRGNHQLNPQRTQLEEPQQQPDVLMYIAYALMVSIASIFLRKMGRMLGFM